MCVCVCVCVRVFQHKTLSLQRLVNVKCLLGFFAVKLRFFPLLTLFFEIKPQSQAQSRRRVQGNEPGPWLGECTHIFLEILL